MAKWRLSPERAFPAEVLALKDQGVPFPSWYVGPLYTGNKRTELAAMALLDAVRADATAGDGDELAPPEF